MTGALRIAIEAEDAARDRVTEILHRDYPVNGPVMWELGGRVQNGTVLRHCYGERIEVRNDRTGATRFIRAHDIVRAL